MAAAKKTAAAPPPADETPTADAPVTLYEYVGEDARTYPDVPISVVPGDVVTWPFDLDTGKSSVPGDGRWTAAKEGASPIRKDNDPEPEVVEEAPAEADPENQEV